MDLGTVTTDAAGEAAVVGRFFAGVMKQPPPHQQQEQQSPPNDDGAAAASAPSYHVEARQGADDGEGTVGLEGALLLGLSTPFALTHTWRDRRLDEGGAATARRRRRRRR